MWAWLFAFLYKSLRLKIFDHDLWWHLATGRMMLEDRVFPRSELFSHTMPGTPWVNFEWLGQVLLYATVNVLGLPAILYGKVAFALLIIVALALMTRRFGARGPALFFLTFVAFMVLRPRLYERIELFTFLFLALSVYLLAGARHATEGRRRITPWVLAGLMVVWCNIHAGFILGLGLAVLFSIGARLAKENERVIKTLDRSLMLMLVAMFINPFGYKIIHVFTDHLVQLFGSPTVIQEWAPLSVRENPFFWLLFSMTSWVLLLGLIQGRAPTRFWAPAVLVFLVWGTLYSRNAATTPFILLPFLADFFHHHDRLKDFLTQRRVQQGSWIAAVALLVYLTPMALQPAPVEVIQANRFPTGACRFVRENQVRGNMYNTYQLGGYIEWEMPGRKVFMDGRYLFHPLLIEQSRLDNALFENPQSIGWQEFLARYKVDYAITDFGNFFVPSQGRAPFPFSDINLMFPRTDWALTYWDDAGLVFLRRNADNTQLINKFEYHALWPYNLAQMQALMSMKMVSPKDVERELERHRQEVVFSVVRGQMEELLQAGASRTQ